MTADLDKEQVSTKENPAESQVNPELAAALRNYVPGSPEEKKLLRKIDARLMPMLWIMYVNTCSGAPHHRHG